MKKKKLDNNLKNNLFNGVFALLTLIIILFFYERIWIATILLSILSIIALIKWKSRITLLVFIFSAVFGVVVEMISLYFGIWNYNLINFYNIPCWLFFAWGNAGIFIYHLALGFRRNKK